MSAGWWRNLDRWDREAIEQLVGTCPFCVAGDSIGAMHGMPTGSIHGTSASAVAMRCELCDLRWTMAWVEIHRAAQRRIAVEGDRELAGAVAALIAPALDEAA
jgi:hypothetical protein